MILGHKRSAILLLLVGNAFTHLISHDHELPISQAPHVRIVLVVLKTHNLLDILDLFVLHNLIVLRLTHVEKLAAQREDTKIVTPDNTKSSHGERLGGVSFGQYKRAVRRVACSSVVCVRELGDTSKTVERLEIRRQKDRKRIKTFTDCACYHPFS